MRRNMVAVFGLLLVSLALSAWAAEEEGPTPQSVKVTVTGIPPGAGQPGVQQFGSADEVQKAFANTKITLPDGIDFAKYDVVFVGWGTSGPPFGQLKFKSNVKTGVTFYVQEPAAQIRGQAYKLGADWFLVPKGTKTAFEKK